MKIVPAEALEVSRYKALYEPMSNNVPYWNEVLIGRTITAPIYTQEGKVLSGLQLDDGQKLMLYNGPVPTFFIEDGELPRADMAWSDFDFIEVAVLPRCKLTGKFMLYPSAAHTPYNTRIPVVSIVASSNADLRHKQAEYLFNTQCDTNLLDEWVEYAPQVRTVPDVFTKRINKVLTLYYVVDFVGGWCRVKGWDVTKASVQTLPSYTGETDPVLNGFIQSYNQALRTQARAGFVKP